MEGVDPIQIIAKLSVLILPYKEDNLVVTNLQQLLGFYIGSNSTLQNQLIR